MAAGNEGDSGTWTVVVSIGVLLVNAIGFIVNGIWTLGRTSKTTDEKIATSVIELERRLKQGLDDSSHNFGQTVAAIRTKVTETELWNRDNFVSKQTFQTVTAEMKRSWERFEDNLNERLDSIDNKLDRNNSSN